METRICVYIDLDGQPTLTGYLWNHARKGRQSATFEYHPSWLKHPERFAIEPALALTRGAFHTRPGKSLFGAFGEVPSPEWHSTQGSDSWHIEQDCGSASYAFL